jgi:16S rRNA (uracil1498-N3)-methyltransferase
MRIPRIYLNHELFLNAHFVLDKEISHRLISVLRIEPGSEIILFTGDGHEYLAKITHIKRDSIQVKIIQITEKDCESPLYIHLGQVISKGERMDFVVQKATELGVNLITPLFSERCVVHLKKDRLEKKQEHWQKIAMHAAEQCGRTKIPLIETPMPLLEWIHNRTEKSRFTLALAATQKFSQSEILETVALMIGPEGGLTVAEVDYAIRHQFTAIKMGPRVLRTETATLVALSAIQLTSGDL